MIKHGSPAPARDCLVAIVTTDADLHRYAADCWYRIPERVIGRTLAAEALTDARWLALYQSASIASALPAAIELCAPVISVETRSRRELIPDEPAHPFADASYRVLHVGRPEHLAQPVVARRPRRVTFVRTSHDILHAATELNDLFIGSPAEESLWQSLRSLDVVRRCSMRVADVIVDVDFAVYSGDRAIGIVCNDASLDAVREPGPWGILRFSPSRVETDLAACVDEIFTALRDLAAHRPARREERSWG